MNGYLVPANTKKSMLIFGVLRPIDLLILGIGLTISVIGLIILGSNTNIWLIIAITLPALIALLLVMPIPNYHNTLVGIQSILNFYNRRRNYVWKGWCVYDEFKDSK